MTPGTPLAMLEPSRAAPRQHGSRLLTVVILAAAGVYIFGDNLDFVQGLRHAPGRDVVSQEIIARGPRPKMLPVETRKWDGVDKRTYIARLQHRRWAAQSQYPRIFGYVLKWDDIKGEGIIIDQEKTQKYLAIRDEIGRCFHNYKTLQESEFVEFFATDEQDEMAGLPLARNVTGAFGRCVKTSQEYRDTMLRAGGHPKRWGDTPDEYEFKIGEWWNSRRWNTAGHTKHPPKDYKK